MAARIPVRTNTDDRYFTDTYQAMPLHGYTKMFEAMLDHPNITVELGVDFADVRRRGGYGHVVYTGPIDAYFEYRYGHLPYRSLRARTPAGYTALPGNWHGELPERPCRYAHY